MAFERKHWIALGVVISLVVVVWALGAGYFPQISKFFAYEPVGYEPLCAWHGEPITGLANQCCSGMVPVPVTLAPIPSVSPWVSPPSRPSDGSIVLKIEDYGQLYCTPDGAGVNRTPTISWSGTALPASNTPVEILHYKPKTGQFEYVRTMTTQNYASIIAADYPLPRPLVYQVRLVSDHSVVSNALEIPIDCSVPQFNPASSYCSVPGCTAVQRSVSCNQSSCPPVVEMVCPPGVTIPPRPSLTPTPTPTLTPTSTGFGTELHLNGNFARVPVARGQMVTVPITLDTAGLAVTALDLSFRVSSGARFAGVVNGTADFPEVLRQPLITGPDLTLAVGSGPRGGRTGSGLNVGSFIIEIARDAPIGTRILISTQNAKIAAAGVEGNVWQLGGKAEFTVTDAPTITPTPTLTGSPAVSPTPTGSRAPKPGDVNGDGTVDIFDYNIVVSNFGKTGATVPGDINNDGKVDIFDYNIVVSNFGK